jgi:hypothetical protein
VIRQLGKTYRELTELGLQSIKAGDFSKAREYWAAACAVGPDEPPPRARRSLETPSTHPPRAATLIKASSSLPPKRAEGR